MMLAELDAVTTGWWWDGQVPWIAARSRMMSCLSLPASIVCHDHKAAGACIFHLVCKDIRFMFISEVIVPMHHSIPWILKRGQRSHIRCRKESSGRENCSVKSFIPAEYTYVSGMDEEERAYLWIPAYRQSKGICGHGCACCDASSNIDYADEGAWAARTRYDLVLQSPVYRIVTGAITCVV